VPRARCWLRQTSTVMTITGTPASRTCLTVFAVPPGNAITRSGLASSSICLLRIGPAARLALPSQPDSRSTFIDLPRTSKSKTREAG
jgi:hypothetical protein